MRWVLPHRCDEQCECLNVIANEVRSHPRATDGLRNASLRIQKVSNMLGITRELSRSVSSKRLRPQIHYHIVKGWQIVMQATASPAWWVILH
jgi:hypothetical protein